MDLKQSEEKIAFSFKMFVEQSVLLQGFSSA